MTLIPLDAYPLAAVTAPGARARFALEVESDVPVSAATLTVRLRDLGRVLATARVEVRLEPGPNRLHVDVDVPGAEPGGSGHGYQALLELTDGSRTVTAATALLSIDHWRHAPRYGFLSEFSPGEVRPERIRELAKFHVTVVQFYDWMYRHYDFLPPADTFVDAMERTLSLRTVTERVAACHAHGMAALAYGAVYGAEAEFVHDRPTWVLKDATGADLSLIERFYVTDLRPGAPWREHILQEFERCVDEVGFDGVHMDQYGFPKWSYDAAGVPVDLATTFPGLIDEAARRVAERREGAAVLFNAVNNWPIEEVAPSDQAAVYIEVWPPHDRYTDLVDLIRRARDLSGKQAVLAAYLEPFREGGSGAEACALLATAVIAAAAGHHLLLGEGDAVLRDPYYPNHGHLGAGFVPRLRRYYDHTAAHHHLLFAADLREVTSSFVTGINTELALQGARASTRPVAGHVWITVRQRADRLVVQIVNLVGVDDDLWNTAKRHPTPLDGLTLRLNAFARVRRVFWASPDDASAHDLEVKGEPDGATSVALPRLEVWATIVIDLV